MSDRGICLLGVAPMRKTADHRSEMVNQLLFGDIVRITDYRNDWMHIEMAEDGYRGWMSKNQLQLLKESDYSALMNGKRMITTSLHGVVTVKSTNKDFKYMSANKGVGIGLTEPDAENFIVSAGSTIYLNSSEDMIVAGKVFKYGGNLKEGIGKQKKQIPELASRFHLTPYLWGGRSAFGIDCSGFAQLVYKMAGICIPRDAALQAQEGESVHLISEAEPGNLVFFDNEEGVITHVGIFLDNNNVIHAHGKVRLDKIDHQGIFNIDDKKYTHKLRIIKRF